MQFEGCMQSMYLYYIDIYVINEYDKSETLEEVGKLALGCIQSNYLYLQ